MWERINHSLWGYSCTLCKFLYIFRSLRCLISYYTFFWFPFAFFGPGLMISRQTHLNNILDSRSGIGHSHCTLFFLIEQLPIYYIKKTLNFLLSKHKHNNFPTIMRNFVNSFIFLLLFAVNLFIQFFPVKSQFFLFCCCSKHLILVLFFVCRLYYCLKCFIFFLCW